MTNYEKFVSKWTEDKFIDLMEYNCHVRPNYMCFLPTIYNHRVDPEECRVQLEAWCKQEVV